MVSWNAIDDTHALATLRIESLAVSGVFEFGADGLPVQMTADRFNDTGSLVPWGGVYRSFRSVSGMLIPFEAEVSWLPQTGRFTYAHWILDSAEYDPREPSMARLMEQPGA